MALKKPFNLNLEYSYRLSVTHKISCRVILAGPAGSNDVAAIKDRLEDEVYFVPGQVFLPDLRCAFDESQRSWNSAVDHPWHELDKINLTKLAPTGWFDGSAPDLVAAFLSVRWDDDYRPGPLKPLFQTQQMASDGDPDKHEP
ncbi:MAG: hypothetical protein WCO00_13415 [Rhodospirillaceae bacterium]